ncbi:uncharacterized protein LOC125177905 [Hyalella azteca]|uniref:Uncharacterized protein LOC125177905 n=1 Tax=Hyalella azteca TaxID=294128 RepID=A0A979FIW8_HYAAZ|nr:uncharacterized protein LOC125177905 [Hyalella azteca]
MDDVFGNSSGETVVESPFNLTLSEGDQTIPDAEKNIEEIAVGEPDAGVTRVGNAKNLFTSETKQLQNVLLRKDVEKVHSEKDFPKISFLDDESKLNELKTAADEFISKLKNKIVDLNDTIQEHNEQNSENHHLEQKLRDLDEDLYMTLDSFTTKQNYVNDISKTPDDESVQISSSIEDYLNHMTKLGHFQRFLDQQNDVTMKMNNASAIKFSPKMTRASFPVSPLPKRQVLSTQHESSPDKVTPTRKTSSFVSGLQPKPRSHAMASLAARHLYQNLPAPSMIRQYLTTRNPSASPAVKSPKIPVYVNVPEPTGWSKVPTALKGSYVELWGTGKPPDMAHLGNEFSDIFKPKSSSLPPTPSAQSPQCRKSISPAYVQMSSPYVRSPASSVFAQLSNSIASYAGHAPQTIFCPLCPRQFSYERALANHIQKSHRLELEAMVDDHAQDLNLYSCPVCQARFFNSSVLPKHLMDCHKDSLISLLEKHRRIVIKSKGMQCPFCVKCVPPGINGEHMLMFHLQQYHARHFEEMISSLFKVSNEDAVNTVNYTNKRTWLEGNTSSTPGLSNRMVSMMVSSDSKRKLEELEKEETCMNSSVMPTKTPKVFEKSEPRRSASKGILRRDKNCVDRPNVKRELRFSVPHVTKEEIYYPESPGPVTPDYTERIDLNTFSYPENRLVPVMQTVLSSQEDFDAITTEESIDISQQGARKRRKLGLSIRSKNIFKCKDKENQEGKTEDKENQQIYMTMNSRSYRRPPKPVAPPVIPPSKSGGGSPCASKLHSTSLSVSSTNNSHAIDDRNEHHTETNHSVEKRTNEHDSETDGPPLETGFSSSVKLYSPLRLFRCNGCRNKFCDNDSLLVHISQQHRGFLSLLRPQFGCGVCSAKFYENKHLVKHCLQNHFSLLEIRAASGEVVPFVNLSRVDPNKVKLRGSMREVKMPVTAL